MINDISVIMKELKNLGDEQIKHIYIKHGAKEPLYGVTTGKLKPIVKKIKKNYKLSMELYETGNYDAMYLAGMIAEPDKMSKTDFDKWIKEAYFAVQTRKQEINEKEANQTHYNIGKNIREVIEKNGGTMPENLPTPKRA